MWSGFLFSLHKFDYPPAVYSGSLGFWRRLVWVVTQAAQTTPYSLVVSQRSFCSLQTMKKSDFIYSEMICICIPNCLCELPLTHCCSESFFWCFFTFSFFDALTWHKYWFNCLAADDVSRFWHVFQSKYLLILERIWSGTINNSFTWQTYSKE